MKLSTLAALVAMALASAQLEKFWDGPWVFAERAEPFPLPSIPVVNDAVLADPWVRLDNNRLARLHIARRACRPEDKCEPSDCGCANHDSYSLDVVDDTGTRIARGYLWAAYDRFEVVPVDLVGGIGDEILIIRIPGRASPPIGHDLKIYRIESGSLTEILSSHRIAGSVQSFPFGCARWRRRVSVDLTATKPRGIFLRREAASDPGCRVDQEPPPEERAPFTVLRYWNGRYGS